ncbi:hypothetical protein NQ317_018095 [Molorchus minor]|uniref:Uncharacterized protein n=1 Tax=Molorchus minor TaxID=1323400 RepID=A0ABQ9JD80_9CUCU|nr:hypothetical protein NQ317_018095 [Molorchus minor]
MDIRLSLFEVFTYLNATPASRNIGEGESILNAGHLILCGVTEFTHSIIRTLGLCLQTSALTKPPHEISGTGNKNDVHM